MQPTQKRAISLLTSTVPPHRCGSHPDPSQQEQTSWLLMHALLLDVVEQCWVDTFTGSSGPPPASRQQALAGGQMREVFRTDSNPSAELGPVWHLEAGPLPKCQSLKSTAGLVSPGTQAI